jgi:hypothetical protein
MEVDGAAIYRAEGSRGPEEDHDHDLQPNQYTTPIWFGFEMEIVFVTTWGKLFHVRYCHKGQENGSRRSPIAARVVMVRG